MLEFSKKTTIMANKNTAEEFFESLFENEDERKAVKEITSEKEVEGIIKKMIKEKS